MDFRCVHRLQLLKVCNQNVTLPNSTRAQAGANCSANSQSKTPSPSCSNKSHKCSRTRCGARVPLFFGYNVPRKWCLFRDTQNFFFEIQKNFFWTPKTFLGMQNAFFGIHSFLLTKFQKHHQNYKDTKK